MLAKAVGVCVLMHPVSLSFMGGWSISVGGEHAALAPPLPDPPPDPLEPPLAVPPLAETPPVADMPPVALPPPVPSMAPAFVHAGSGVARMLARESPTSCRLKSPGERPAAEGGRTTSDIPFFILRGAGG